MSIAQSTPIEQVDCVIDRSAGARSALAAPCRTLTIVTVYEPVRAVRAR
jgi:hypothetical protein